MSPSGPANELVPRRLGASWEGQGSSPPLALQLQSSCRSMQGDDTHEDCHTSAPLHWLMEAGRAGWQWKYKYTEHVSVKRPTAS